jgi:hypothetical protein
MSAFETASAASAFDTAGDLDGGADTGPFAPAVNSALTSSFDLPLDGISVERGAGETSRALDAHAYTIGTTISLGDRVREDVDDPFSMEVIAHEVAHALAGGGSGATAIDRGKDDAGEVAAHAASGAFRDYVATGRTGAAPRLRPAYGGEATIHRFEAGEHADAVDHMKDNIDPKKLDPAVAKMMEQEIHMPNGATLTQGQITAMMGDFYGAYDKNGKFDPMASFEAMQKAPREEMEALQAKIVDEQTSVTAKKGGTGDFKGTANADFESLTNDRHLTIDPVTGTTTGYSYMDLAKKNTNHFNKEDETDTNGNAGSYAVLHAEAMKEAQKAADLPAGEAKDKARERALALEASSQHFMTDRFSAGHQFDKEQLVNANGGEQDDEANLRSRVMHDIYNEGGPEGPDGEPGHGTSVHNGKGEDWKAMGDEHWADDDNKKNREKAAEATQGSYGDINAILKGEKKQDDIDPMAGFHATAPAWDPDLNAKIQQDGKDLGLAEMLWKEKGQALLLPAMGETALKKKLHEVQDSETWKDVKQGASDAWDWTKGAAKTVGDGASDAWDYTKQKGGELLDWGQQAAQPTIDAVSNGANQAWDWTKGAANTIATGAGNAWDATKSTATDAYNTVAPVVSNAYDTVATGVSDAYHTVAPVVSNAYDTVATGASNAYDTVATGASNAYDTVATGASNAWGATKQVAGAASDAVSDGVSYVGDKATAAKDAFLGLFD